MAKFTNNNKTSIEIKPFTDTFRFIKIVMHESIGGSIANGAVDFEIPNTEEASSLIQETHYINIEMEQDGGNSYKISALITSKKVIDNQFSIEFSCMDNSSFIDETLSLSFRDIDEAIEYSYKGRKDIRCESDLSNNVPIVQFQETSYDFCKRIATSFKYDSIFTFGLEGFMIKDTVGINSLGEKDPKIYVISGTGSIVQEQSVKSNLNPRFYKKPFDSWNETEDGEEVNESNKTDHGQDEYTIQSKNAASIVNFDKYSVIHKDVLQLKKNFDYNKRFYNSNYYNNLSICYTQSIPNYKIGDIIFYTNVLESGVKNPYKLYIVYENDITMVAGATVGQENKRNFAWRTLLKCIEDQSGEILNQENNPSKKS